MDAGGLYRLARRCTSVALIAMQEDEGSASPVDVEVFADVARHPGTCVADVVARTGISQPAVSKAVARIRAEGYFEVRRDELDGRRVRIGLAEGVSLDMGRRSARDVGQVLVERFGISDGDAAEALRLLEQVEGLLRPAED